MLHPRVYFPVESLAGLGHFNRAGILVKAMQKAGMEVAVGSGTFVDAERFFPNAERIVLPRFVHRNSEGVYTQWNDDGQKVVVKDHDHDAWRRLRAEAHREAVRRMRPDVIIFEFWPFSRRNLTNEVLAIINEVKQQRLNPLVISSVRDVIKGDVTSLTGNKRRYQHANDNSALDKLKYVDAIIVHGDERLIGLDNTYTQLKRIAHMTYYSGYVVAELPSRDDTIPHEKRSILIHAGSGSGGEDFFQAVVRAWEYTTLQNHPWHFVTGPRFPAHAWEALTQNLIARGGVKLPEVNASVQLRLSGANGAPPAFVIEHYRTDLLQLMADSALSVSLAGYNTTQELLALNARALLAPKFRSREEGIWVDPEQSYRLEQLEAQKLARTLTPREIMCPQTLGAAMDMAYAETLPSASAVNFDGAAATARLIMHLSALRQHRPRVA